MKKRKKLRVALFFGGKSDERDVSLNTGKTIAEYFDSNKYEVIPVEISKTGKWLLQSATIKQIGKRVKTKKVKARDLAPIEKTAKGQIDVALLALHGPGGEDGTIQGMLELLGIAYTGSGVLASALAMDKARTKRLVASSGIPVLPHVVVSRRDFKTNIKKILQRIKGMVVVKPNHLGSSIGVTITNKKKEIEKGIKTALRYSPDAIIEPFIDGREITVPVLGNSKPEALPIVEVLPWKKSKFYDYKSKYEEGGSQHIIPAPLTASQERAVQEMSVEIHRLLGCRGVTRADFILDKKGKFHFLEINTIPGMTSTSLVPQSAEVAGISFSQLLDKLVKFAKED